MGQAEIIKLLKKTKKYLTVEEIAKKLNVSKPSVYTCIRRMEDELDYDYVLISYTNSVYNSKKSCIAWKLKAEENAES
jgi:predicted DNA-binding protein YlxM (UPF0122 family)